MACRAFMDYIEPHKYYESFGTHSKERIPSREIYNRIYADFVPYDKRVHGE